MESCSSACLLEASQLNEQEWRNLVLANNRIRDVQPMGPPLSRVETALLAVIGSGGLAFLPPDAFLDVRPYVSCFPCMPTCQYGRTLACLVALLMRHVRLMFGVKPDDALYHRVSTGRLGNRLWPSGMKLAQVIDKL